MSIVTNGITRKEITEYWKSLFPVEKTVHDIDDILFNVSSKRINDLLNEYTLIKQVPKDEQSDDAINHNTFLTHLLDTIYKHDNWVYFYVPMLKKHFHYLVDGIKQLSIVEDIKNFTKVILVNMCNMLHGIAFQTIIVEIYHARKDGLLKGNSSVERGNYFSSVLLKDKDYLQSIFENYPELARIMDIKIQNVFSYVIKVLKETERELPEIEKKINSNKKLGKLQKMVMGEGDTHNFGKTVTRLIFQSGITIMYKPHSLQLDENFNELLQWLNNVALTDNKYAFYNVKTYTKNDSGWMEFIQFEECDNDEELKRFYYRIGLILAILYTTNGVDIHHENLIAKKEFPVLIDMETIIHPDTTDDGEPDSIIQKAIREIESSIAKNALLPTYVTSKNSDKVLDLGGLGASEKQESPFLTKFIENYGTDDAKVKIMNGIIDTKCNNPIISGKIVDSKIYREDIISGFKDLYNWIFNNRIKYIAKINELFGTVTARVIFRPTNVYAQLLNTSYHPDLLTNHTDRFVYLHRLANKNFKNAMVFSEIQDLLDGDIPYFSTQAINCNVHGTRIKNCNFTLREPTIETIIKKINSMNEIDMFRQISIINSKMMTEPFRSKLETAIIPNGKSMHNIKSRLIYAENIADFILQRSIADTIKKNQKIERTWFGSEETEHGFPLFKPLNVNLYDGLAGIAMFYNYLHKISNNQMYSEITKQTYNTILQMIPGDQDNVDSIELGAFSGLAGVAYLLLHIEPDNESTIYTNDILRVLDIISKYHLMFKQFDVTRDAGILGIAITLCTKTRNQRIKQRAMEICNLIYHKIKENILTIDGMPGITWNNKGYSGYAHGNAGMAVLLYRLFKITNNEEIKNLVKRTLHYERAMYDQNERNWRRSIDETNFSSQWCHGAAGVALSKLQLLQMGYEDDQIFDELKIAIDTTIKTGLGNDLCLCHGDMGNLVIVKEAGIVLNDKQLVLDAIATIEHLAEKVMQLMQTDTFKGYENHGFMLGLSGIGYELLRIGRENEMPNVMALE